MKAMPCLACSNEMLCAIADALATGDIDQALELGLLDSAPQNIDDVCRECGARARIMSAARDERLRSLAARERFRAREHRLTERAAARARKRASAAPQTLATASATTSSLPPAAAAALARAKARVAAKHQPE